MASLFTSQTPASPNNSDGAPGITTATTVQFAQAGYVTAIRFYATTTVSGTYTGALWQVTDNDDPAPGAGTLLGSKVRPTAPTAGTWNLITLDTPIAVSPGVLYRTGVHNSAGRYVTTGAFFGSALTNGDITAPESGTDPVGLGTLRQGVFEVNAALTYPDTTFNLSNYFVDVDFVLSLSGSGVAAVGTAPAAATARASAVKVVAAAGRCTAAPTVSARARKAYPATARAASAAIARATTAHVARPTARAAAVATTRVATAKRTAPVGTVAAAAVAAATATSGSARSAAARCVAAGTTTAVAGRLTATTARTTAAGTTRATAAHRTNVTAGVRATATARSASTKRLPAAGRVAAAARASGVAVQLTATRPAAGRCVAVAVCHSRIRLGTRRPYSGTTTRPTSGTTTRPSAGVTYRP